MGAIRILTRQQEVGIVPLLRVGLILLASLGGQARAADDARERGDLAIQARAILKTYCSECHGARPGLFDVLVHSQLTDSKKPVPFVNLDTPEHSQIIEFLEDGTMPPGKRPRPARGEIDVLKKWILAKAPRYPKSFDDSYVLKEVLADWTMQKLPGNYRYVSFAHLVSEGQRLSSLQPMQSRLVASLAAATSKEKSVDLQPVDEAATIFRLDVARLGWLEKDLFHEIGLKGEDIGTHPIVPLDLILLENPYLLARDARFEAFLGSPQHVRPAPFLRGDWLAAVIAPNSPLAEDLKSLVELADAMKSSKPVCGPRVRVFEERIPIPGAPNSPLTAWYGPERLSSVFAPTFTWKDKTSIPIRLNESFRFDATVQKDGSFRLLNILPDGQLRVVPVMNTILKKGEVNKVGPTKDGYFKIPSIPDGNNTATEHWILIVGEDVPVPTIVRSEHSSLDCPKGRGPVFRFVFDKNFDRFDPEKTARKMIELKVTRQ
jgi:mono/diheme cytochrome c family protein